jgi:hypothetical protein
MNLRAKSALSIGVLSLLCFMLPSSLRADDFTFSFTGENNVTFTDETISGEILGLTNNTTGPATEVIITSITGGFGGGDSNLLANQMTSPYWHPEYNDFTEVDGVVTSEYYLSYIDDGYIEVGFGLGINPNNDSPGTAAAISAPTLDEEAVVGSATFAPMGTVSTPEPGSGGLMLIGIGSLGLMMVTRGRIGLLPGE